MSTFKARLMGLLDRTESEPIDCRLNEREKRRIIKWFLEKLRREIEAATDFEIKRDDPIYYEQKGEIVAPSMPPIRYIIILNEQKPGAGR